jgi:bifunctional non-homologous end joining protein LigD
MSAGFQRLTCSAPGATTMRLCFAPSISSSSTASTPIEQRKQALADLLWLKDGGIVLNALYDCDGETIFKHACALGCEGIVSKRLGSPYRSGRSLHWIKVKNPKAPAVKREADEDWTR